MIYSINVIGKNELEILPSNIVRTWSENIGVGSKCLLDLQH